MQTHIPLMNMRPVATAIPPTTAGCSLAISTSSIKIDKVYEHSQCIILARH